nr:conjugal transfer protein TraO [Spirosoma oryzae]
MVGVGLERINQNQPELAEGTILTQPAALASMQLGLEGELFLTERTALFVGLHERWLPSSNLTQFRTYGLVGMRFSFFKN